MTDLLINPDRTPKTMSVWRTLRIKIARWIMRVWMAFSSQLSLTALGMFVTLLVLIKPN